MDLESLICIMAAQIHCGSIAKGTATMGSDPDAEAHREYAVREALRLRATFRRVDKE